jgi:type 1 glutamine amidotransferase
MLVRLSFALTLLLVAVTTLTAQTPEQLEQINAALPAEPAVKPAQPRKLLVFTLTRGFRHDSIPVGVAAMKLLGEKTKAFTVTHSEDLAVFEEPSLKQFDAVLFLNTTGELFRPADFDTLSEPARTAAADIEKRLETNLLKFVEGGKGLAGFHSATDTCYKWQWYGNTIGGYFDGHPWVSSDDVVISVDDPAHPIAAPFGGQPLELKEELYQLREPYARDKQRVLLTLDTTRTNMKKDGVKRTDGDFGVAWVRLQGQGRVFYTSLGHNAHIYTNPKILRHYLAGLQFVLGDLKVDTTPIPRKDAKTQSPEAKPAEKKGGPRTDAVQSEPEARARVPHAASAPAGFTALFNGKDLSGWKGLVAADGGPPARAKMSKEELAKAQTAADDEMNAHWSAEDGVLVFDGKGRSLCTARDYRDFEMLVDWKIEAGGDSGIYLRGSPQVQIWDPAKWPEGSGGLYNNEKNPKKPLVCADKPIGEWNSFRIKMVGEKVSVWLNDKLVVDNVVLENYWERDKPIYPSGQIELQNHGSKLYFRDIFIREL